MCPRKHISKSVKPIVLDELVEIVSKKTIEIKDSDAVIAAYLSARGFEISKKASENREILAEYAASEDKKLIREWSLKITILNKNVSGDIISEEIKASVTNTLSLKDLLSSLESRGYDLPKKATCVSNGKIVNSLEKLNCKSTLSIIARP